MAWVKCVHFLEILADYNISWCYPSNKDLKHPGKLPLLWAFDNSEILCVNYIARSKHTLKNLLRYFTSVCGGDARVGSFNGREFLNNI